MAKGKISLVTLALLVAGIAIQLPAVFRPLDEGPRNAQTAVMTAGMVEGGSLRFDPLATWRGDLPARLAMEFPAYNLLVLGLAGTTGLALDAAGRTVSLALWITAFLVLQALWRRALAPGARAWANTLFVFAPMNLYLSTAFMPEMLLQLLSIAFLVASLDYARNPSGKNLLVLSALALGGLLVKLPSFAHLGIYAAAVTVDQRGPRALLRPGLYVCGALVLAAVGAWGAYVAKVDASFFPDWAGTKNLVGFIRPEASRLSLSYYAPLVAGNLAFIIPVTAAPFALLGLGAAWARRKTSFGARTWLYLLAALAIHWLVWGKGPAAQSYYNLPNLVCFCALFGLGAALAAKKLRAWQIPRPLRIAATSLLALSLPVAGVAGLRYLAEPDAVVVEAAKWLRANTAPGDIILYQPRHTPSVVSYQHQPLLPYMSARRCFLWTPTTPADEKGRALEVCGYAVVSDPRKEKTRLQKLREIFRGQPPVPPSLIQTYPGVAEKLFAGDSFAVYRLNRNPSP